MDTSLFGVVDDWDACCNYDWGTNIFDKTKKSLHHGLYIKKNGKEGESEPSYSLYSFPYAFQVCIHMLIKFHIVTLKLFIVILFIY